MRHPRDTQRTRVYRSTWALLEDEGDNPAMPLPMVEQYIDRTLAEAQWEDLHCPAPGTVLLHDGRGRRAACANMWRIKLPLWARRPPVILHELSHVILLRTTPSYAVAPHGREFAGIYLTLVGWRMGKAARKRLLDLYRIHRVKYVLPPWAKGA